MAEKKQNTNATTFTIGNTRGDLVHPDWSKFPGWGPDSPGPYQPNDLMTCSGRGDKDGNVWLTIHNYQGEFGALGNAYPGRCVGAPFDFSWPGDGSQPAGTTQFFESPYANPYYNPDITDPAYDPDPIALYLRPEGGSVVSCNYNLGTEFYLGKTAYHGGNIPCYYEVTPDGYLIIRVQYYLSLSGYYITAPVPPFRPAFPDPVLVTFPADAIPLYYYPGGVYDASQNKFISCDDNNHFMKMLSDREWKDILNQYGEGTKTTDQGLILSNRAFNKINRLYPPTEVKEK